MPPITLQRSRAPAALLLAAALGAVLGVFAFGRVRVAFVMARAPARTPAVAEVTPPAVRPCLATRDVWFSGHDRPRMVNHRYDPMQWYEVADDCRGQAVTLAATDAVRVVIADGESARTVTLPLAVPQESGHFQLSAGIDLLVHDGTIAVVGHAAEDRYRLRAMLSDDGGWTWTARDLGSIPHTWLNDARYLGDGTLQWRLVGSRDWKS